MDFAGEPRHSMAGLATSIVYNENETVANQDVRWGTR